MFITFDGPDGSGKTTQIGLFEDKLNSLIQNGLIEADGVIYTKEPGGTPLGSRIRGLLLGGEYTPSPEAEMLLFLADRAQHVKDIIQPRLDHNNIVLCDRFSDSTTAYQLAARKIATQREMKTFQRMIKFAECGATPDLRVWLDVPLELSLERLSTRLKSGGEKNRLDNESVKFHKAVHNAYHNMYDKMSNEERDKIALIDASGTIEEVQGNIQQSVIPYVYNFYQANEPTGGFRHEF